MRHVLVLGLLAALAGACGSAPSEEPTTTNEALVSNAVPAESCRTLIAGQHTDVGEVCVWSDGVTLYVEYRLDGPWLKEAHTWVGTTPNYPGAPGNPSPGQISQGPTGDNSGVFEPRVDHHVAAIPLSAIGAGCGDPIYLLAHAALSTGETAWAEGDPAPGSNWAMIARVPIYCPGTPDDERCETAFAYGGPGIASCFLDEPLELSRWGWTNLLEPTLLAPPFAAAAFRSVLPPPAIEMPLLAGASGCRTDATRVGTVWVRYVAGEVEVTFDVWPAFALDETQVYVGSDPAPRMKNHRYTVAPGQYGGVPDSDGVYRIGHVLPAWLIAHAVVCSTEWPDGPTDPGPQ